MSKRLIELPFFFSVRKTVKTRGISFRKDFDNGIRTAQHQLYINTRMVRKDKVVIEHENRSIGMRYNSIGLLKNKKKI